MKTDRITQELVRELLLYSPKTGVFIWRKKDVKHFSRCNNPSRACAVWNSRYNKSEAGFTSKKDWYNRIRIDYVSYKSSRLAFLFMTGAIPKDIDHIDRDRTNDSWINLRQVSRSENNINRSIQKNNKTGVSGVHVVGGEKYYAKIMINGKHEHLGCYNLLYDAACARYSAELKYGWNIINNDSSAKRYVNKVLER